MAFELIVAAKRDPVETAERLQREEPKRPPAPPTAATLDVNGAFSEASAAALAQRIGEVLHHPADTVIVRFHDIACDDVHALAGFAQWVAGLRAQGHDVRIAAGNFDAHALLEGPVTPDALVPPVEANAITGRRVLHVPSGPELL